MTSAEHQYLRHVNQLDASAFLMRPIADDALYKAKHQSRNRVVAPPSPAAQSAERSSNPIGSAPPS